MKQGDTVVCVWSSSGYLLTRGKEYTVLKVIPKRVCDHFTYPEYVNVADDSGEVVECWSTRFQLKE